MNRLKQFLSNRDGVTAIEAAFLFPVAIMLTFGAIEFGHYYVTSQSTSKNVGGLAQRINLDYEDPGNVADVTRLSDETSYICAVTAPSYTAAEAADCRAPGYNVSIPEDQDSAYVKVVSRVQRDSTTLSGIPFFENLLPVVEDTRIVRIARADDCPTDDRPKEEFGMCENVSGTIVTTHYTYMYGGNEASEWASGLSNIEMRGMNIEEVDPVCTPTGWACQCAPNYYYASYRPVQLGDHHLGNGGRGNLRTQLSYVGGYPGWPETNICARLNYVNQGDYNGCRHLGGTGCQFTRR